MTPDTRGVLAIALAAACGCGSTTEPRVVAGAESWDEADALFRRDPRWLGGDGALGVDLGGDRLLWLFGDSFVATSPANVRTESELVRNTVAVMTGRDPLTASMAFHWRTEADGSPGPFFADAGDEWHWPAHGLRVDGGPLLLFLAAVRADPGGLGFTEAGYRVVRVADPDADPSTWVLEWIEPPAPSFDPDVTVGTAVVRDGDHVVALTSGNHATHTGWLVRWPAADAAAGDLSRPEWWTGAAWTAQADLTGAPAALFDDAGPECSLHFDARLGRWVHVKSEGFGATTIAVRVAPALTGPYGPAVDAFTPPESTGPDPFVYAAKAHPELTGFLPDALVVTYATNSFTFGDLFTPPGTETLYWPRVVVLRLR